MDEAFAEALARNDLKGFRKRLNEALTNQRRIELERFLPLLREVRQTRENPAELGRVLRDFAIDLDAALAPFALTSYVWNTGGYWFLPYPDPTTENPYFTHFLRLELYYPLDSSDWSEFTDIILTQEEWPLYLHGHALQRLRERVFGSDWQALQRLITATALLYNPLASTCQHLQLKQIGVAIGEDAMLMGTCELAEPGPTIWLRTVVTRPFSARQEALHAATYQWLQTVGANMDFESDPWAQWSYPALDDGWEALAAELDNEAFHWLKESRKRVTQFDQEFEAEVQRVIHDHANVSNVIPFPKKRGTE